MLRSNYGYGNEVTRTAPRSPNNRAPRQLSDQDLLRVSPALAFAPTRAPNAITIRNNLLKDKFASPPFVVVTKEEGSRTDLHPYLNKSKWKLLLESVLDLQRFNRPEEIEMALMTLDDNNTTPLHVAAWKAPPKIALLMLNLVPGAKRREFLLAVDHDGNTPLHLACANLDERVEFSVIKHVLLLAPEALEMRNNYGDSPLHLLVSSPGFSRGQDFAVEAAAEEAITSLLMMVGHMAIIRNRSGATLLHVAIAHGAHERVLVQVLNLAPTAAHVPDNHGMLPLHYVAAFGGRGGTPWTFAGQLIWAFPEAISSQSEHGDTPLHLLISNAYKHVKKDQFLDRNTTKLAELLVGSGMQDNCPLLIKNNEHLTPLHGCALFDTPPQLTRLLMESPLAIQASHLATNFGATALHLCCANSNVSESVANVEALATIYSCSAIDSKNRTALMVAVQNSKASSKVTKALLKVDPDCANVATVKGQHLALHLALQGSKIRGGAIKALLKAYPEGVRALTTRGNTPLHEACKYGAPISVIEILISHYPSALRHANEKGQLPIDRAQSAKASDEVMAVLEGRDFVRSPVPNTVSEDFTVDFASPELFTVSANDPRKRSRRKNSLREV